MSTSRLTTLGGFAFTLDGVSTRRPATQKARALMAFLIMNRGVDLARERLLEVFWPDADADHARGSLKTALWSIRRCLRTAGGEADEHLLATKAMVRWSADTIVDAVQFADLAARNDSASNREALQLYRGDFLEGDYDDWAVAERERLAAVYETVLARVVRSGKDAEAAQRFIARNPYDEEAYAVLIESELAAGRRSSASAWVERARKALTEVGEKPSVAFETQFGSILHVEPLVAEEVTLPFAGREAELAFLAARIADAASGHGSVTLVRGEAGIGKSTLLDRAMRCAAQSGLRVLVIRCEGEAPSTFGPWQKTFQAVGAGDFERFVRAHAGDLTVAMAQAIVDRLPTPTAIIVDDVHELAAEALDIFVTLVQATMSGHAVIAGLRPEGVSTIRSQLADVAFEELHIGHLDRSSLKWALAQALGKEQPDVLDVLYDRTAGHPLFFSGLLNSLVTAGALARNGYQWHLIKPIDVGIELPNTVKRFIVTRLHARGDTARTVACALALEPAASAEDLTAVLRIDESTVLDAIDDLLALGLITQPSSGMQFAFSHDLIREVAATELNVGRRTALHRAFAERLKASTVREASIRLARHLEHAGEHLAAAESYLKSAHEAMELNATQDAIDRCDEGIRAGEKLERSSVRDVMLSRLHTAAARAVRGVNTSDAIARARDAVTLARAAGDSQALAEASLALAVLEGLAFDFQEQKSDAAIAAQHAKSCGNEALEAQALVQQANAARELGSRDEALTAAKSARDLALKCGRSDIVVAANEELLRTQGTWWLFNDAFDTARTGMDAARREAQFVEASFLQARSTLWYLLERYDDAESDLGTAQRKATEPITTHQEPLVVPVHPQPYVLFGCQYMAAKISIAREQWDKALEVADKAEALTNVAKLPRHREALALLRIDALLRRGLPDDDETARNLMPILTESTLAHGMIGWSDGAELARARIAARLRMPDATAQLGRVLNTLEENAHRALLDADWAFARLAEAAFEVSDFAVARRARARATYYRSRRLTMAGAAWGRQGLSGAK